MGKLFLPFLISGLRKLAFRGSERVLIQHGRVFLEPVFQRREDALGALEAESQEFISVDAGPVQIGTLEDAFTEFGLSELAKHYFAAFRQEIQCLPYFANAKK